MSKRSPIRITQISDRKPITFKTDSSSRVTLEMCNYAGNVLNEAVVSELAKNISQSVVDCNNHWKTIIELATKLNTKEGKRHPNLQSVIEYHILPKLYKENINEAMRFMEENESIFDRNKMHGILSDTMIMERIISNNKSLSKRFNFDKIARESVRLRKTQDGVIELCELIDTYDTSKTAKFNIAMENITYSMGVAGSKESIIEHIIDYFMTNESVITDYDYQTMQSLIKNSRLISQSDKSAVSYFTEAENGLFTNRLATLSVQCKNKESSDFISTASHITNEKKASLFIKKSFKMMELHPEDSKMIISAIFTIPLIGKVSKAFVSYQYKILADKDNITNKIDDKKFIDTVNDILDDDDLLIESDLLLELTDSLNQPETISTGMDITDLLESENYGESEDIDKLLKEFKTSQKKDMGKFKYYLGKIYRKSPESIIDETPNILTIVRAIFILTPAVLPIIGPVISLIMAFVDKLLSMKINDKQSAALIRKLESEKEKVNKDIDKKPDRKAELEKYKKCIDSCIRKVDGYREANISSEEIPNRKKSDDSNFDFDLGMDDNKDPWAEFNLEDASIILNATETIVSAIESKLQDRLCDVMNINVRAGLNDLLEIVSYCPTSIDMNTISNSARSVKSEFPMTESVLIEASLQNTNICCRRKIDSTKDLIIEAFCIEQLEEYLNEQEKSKGSGAGAITKLKLLLQVAKGKVKDLSTKEKAMWRNIDIATSGFMKSLEKAMTSDRREAIIKGSIIPSFSKCIKAGTTVGVAALINPILGVITAMGMIGVSKQLNYKERQLIYDEIDTELKVVEKQIELANNDGDMKQYRFLLQYQKRLDRERQRIKYGIKVHGRNIPDSRPKGDY